MFLFHILHSMHQEITFILPSKYTRINHFHYHQYFHPGQNHHVLSPALLIFLCLFLTSNRTCGVKSLKGSWDHITPLLKTLHSTFPDCTLSLTLPPIHLDQNPRSIQGLRGLRPVTSRPHLLLSAPFRFLERCRHTAPTLEPSHSPSPLFWMPFSQIANSLLPSTSPTLTALFNIQPPTPSRHIPLAPFHGAPFHLPCIHPLLHTETFIFYHLSHTTRTQIQELHFVHWCDKMPRILPDT